MENVVIVVITDTEEIEVKKVKLVSQVNAVVTTNTQLLNTQLLNTQLLNTQLLNQHTMLIH